MLHVVLAESSLELVPDGMRGHPSVRAHAGRLGRRPSGVLLDNSWHYAAMRGARQEGKRGRPDLVHFAILAATSTPLYRTGLARLYVHTIGDVVVRFGEGVRIPKSYHRFEGLFARLLAEGRVDAGEGPLLEAAGGTLPDLVRSIGPSGVAGLSVSGRPANCREVVAGLGDDPCVVVGGFQKGDFGEATSGMLEGVYSISPHPLESHVVVSRLMYEAENHFYVGGPGPTPVRS